MESYTSALTEFEKLGDYLDSEDLAQDCKDRLKRQELATTISAGIRYTVGIKNDKTVIATSYNEVGQSNVSGWNNIVSISAKSAVTIGLKYDGTVVASHQLSNIDVSDWSNIIAVAAGERYVIGLKNDGTLVSQGHDEGDGQRNVSNWEGITSIAAGWRHTVGLDKNGKIWITGYGSSSQQQQIEKEKDKWTNIIAIAAGGGSSDNPGSGHTVGLRADGTVVAVGDNSYGQCNVTGKEWRNIVAIAAGDWHTVGLRADGTVVSTKPDDAPFYLGACDVDDWEGIIEVSAGCGTTIGLKADGTTIAVGYNDYNQSDEVNCWKGIMLE
ncbi:MAG: chromosome condensation regulator [Lachnospiraceae bacterium]|nr:chromosome condensation regulator [Lachnospiraceae bacterium]